MSAAPLQWETDISFRIFRNFQYMCTIKIVCAQCTLLVLYNGVDFQIKGAFSQCHVIDVKQEQYCLVRETRYVHGEHQRLSASH